MVNMVWKENWFRRRRMVWAPAEKGLVAEMVGAENGLLGR
jgi:hypothetical protein